MNNTFEIKRFWKYLRYDLIRARRNFGLSFLILAMMPLFLFVISKIFFYHTDWLEVSNSFRYTIAIVVLFIAMVNFPQKQYGQITDKQAGSDFLMIPASVFEKFLSMILISCLILPVSLVALSTTCDCLMSLIPSYGHPLIESTVASIQKLAEEAFGMDTELVGLPWIPLFMWTQGILSFNLGAMVFKRAKAAKTFLCIILINFLFVIIMGNHSVNASFKDMLIDDPFQTFNILANSFMIITTAVLLAANYLVIRNIKH